MRKPKGSGSPGECVSTPLSIASKRSHSSPGPTNKTCIVSKRSWRGWTGQDRIGANRAVTFRIALIEADFIIALMSSRPVGTVTFLFTDMEGSTRAWEAYPEETGAALRRHDLIVATEIERHGGAV